MIYLTSCILHRNTPQYVQCISISRLCPLSRLSDGLHGAFKARWPLLLLLATSDSISLPALQVLTACITSHDTTLIPHIYTMLLESCDLLCTCLDMSVFCLACASYIIELQESLSKVKGRTKHKEKKEKEEEEAALASTESAAQALEVIPSLSLPLSRTRAHIHTLSLTHTHTHSRSNTHTRTYTLIQLLSPSLFLLVSPSLSAHGLGHRRVTDRCQ